MCPGNRTVGIVESQPCRPLGGHRAKRVGQPSFAARVLDLIEAGRPVAEVAEQFSATGPDDLQLAQGWGAATIAITRTAVLCDETSHGMRRRRSVREHSLAFIGPRRRLHMPHICLNPKAMGCIVVAAAFASVPLRSSGLQTAPAAACRPAILGGRAPHLRWAALLVQACGGHKPATDCKER